MTLRFSPANTKLRKLEKKINKKVYSFDLLSGHSCPCAKDCHSKVVNGKIVDGEHTKFRCYSASQEAFFRNVYKLRNDNLQFLKGKTCPEMTIAILENIPYNAEIIRIHSAGDFFSKNYLKAWINVAKIRSDLYFYFYTKFLPGLVGFLPLPKNMSYTASYGGTHDYLIENFNLRYTKVVFSEQEAKNLNLQIDKNDFFAYNPNGKQNNFALLIHGIQPKNSEASKALYQLKIRKAA